MKTRAFRKPTVKSGEVVFAGVDGAGVRAECRLGHIHYSGTGETRGQAIDALFAAVEAEWPWMNLLIKGEE